MSLIVRIFVVFFALMISIMVAGFALAAGVMLPDFITLASDPVEKFSFFAMAFFTTSFAGAYAFVPALILIAIAETFDIRSIFYYAIGGGLIALLGYYSADISPALENTTDISPVSLWHAAGRGLRHHRRLRLLVDRRAQGRALEKSVRRGLITPT